ncbi:unnamed protein product [Paramecium pentaurelia]|uniref:Bms1-type G domain-containing protein n=1 Tax=Paramecium pentaurelia TaxID=43138 RepID=A0A8S1WCB4_9CILI|nr:unnamed protein product [Paramecium pentaurelia]
MSDSEEEQVKQAPIIKPHQKQQKDFYAEQLQANEEADSQAPLLVVVQGPKGSGKTTLIKSLVKHYTGQKIKKLVGPVTVRSNKQHRVTFIECPSDINAMSDLSKVADLALILIDASIGFEMETFEYLSLLNNHGFPNVMGVLTHIDFFKDNKQLRKTRKKYKKRFEYETGGNYKLFYLQALKNEYYLKQDIHNLARFISIIKIAPVRWKTEHPFILADRYEQGKDNTTTFYGYVRGCTYRLNDRIHFVGQGDYYIDSFEEVLDPVEIITTQKKHRSLKDTEKLVYAPMSSVGALTIDATAGYITIPQPIFTEKNKFVNNEEQDDEEIEEQEQEQELPEGVRMVRELQQLTEGIDKQLEEEEDAQLLEGFELEEDQPIKKKNNQQQIQQQRELVRLKNRVNIKIENGTVMPISDTLLATDLHELIYQNKNGINEFDSVRYIPKVSDRDSYKEIKELFVTGFYGQNDVVDLENLEKQIEVEEQEQEEQEQEQEKKDNNQKDDSQNQKDNQQQRQQLVNELTSSNLGLYKKGTYVKIVIKDFSSSIKDDYPMILARSEVGEDNLGFIKIRIKKHRWHSNILKSNDPIIISLGWRRFQTIPIYCVQDPNDRLRFIKYTPEYEYCYAIFYGNFAPQGTGLVCTQSLSNKLSKFRIAATGIVLEMNHQFDVMKKLKLVGEPFKVIKNTAFIKGMFNSSLEVAKFQGGLIKTVSGLRGHIKKPSKLGPDGSFRATFEDKIQMSDLVFCRTWVRMHIERFYRLITSNVKLMKTMWELRQEKQIPLEFKPESTYQDQERVPVKFAPLRIPNNLQQNLPFESKEKVKSLSFRERLRQQVEKNLPVKSNMTDKEKEVYSLIQRLNTIKNEKEKKREQKDINKQKIKEAQFKGQKQHLEEGKRKYKQQKQKDKFIKQVKKQQQQQ